VVEAELRHAGRPRDPRLDEALLRCALEVFLELGYHASTFSEIARRAGLGTPAIYRRWPTKAAIAMDLFDRQRDIGQIPDSGSVREVLIEFTRHRLRTWRTLFFHQVALPLLLEAQADPALGAAFAQRFAEYPTAILTRLRRGIEGGELRENIDPNRLLDLLMGTIALPLLFGQEVPLESEAGSIVDQVLTGFGPQIAPKA
jgi:AcrR family transcriptional regulator